MHFLSIVFTGTLVLLYLLPYSLSEPLDLAYSCIHIASDKNNKDLPPVILLHGLTDSRQTWTSIYQIIALETGRRVCIADARNHGDSPWSNDVSFESMADDVIRLMDHLDIPKASIVGHSMGGKTAVVLALTKSDRIEKIVVEDMKPNGIEPDALKLVAYFMFMLNQSTSAIPKGATLEEAKQAIAEYIVKHVQTIDPNMKVTKEMVAKIPLECTNGTCRWKSNLEAYIKAFRNPKEFLKDTKGVFNGGAMFIYGTESFFKVYNAKDEIMELFPKAQLVPIKGASHNIHMLYPQFLRHVINFLNENSNSN